VRGRLGKRRRVEHVEQLADRHLAHVIKVLVDCHIILLCAAVAAWRT
jgi:hypothetical protein